MNEEKILCGKVSKLTLPVIQPPSGPGTPILKRLALPQGELAQFYDDQEGIRYIAFIELLAGAPRGNHYHMIKEEWIYLVRGTLSLIVEDIVSKARDSFSLVAGDLVRISTGVAHTLQIVDAGQAIEFSTARFDPKDIYRYVLV